MANGQPFCPWVGTLFSLGHGGMVAVTAGVLGVVMKNFTFPSYFDHFASWVSIISLSNRDIKHVSFASNQK
ncbi:hypothetical protein MUB16_05515 [Priestia sp. OVL9]|nr:hypothetical protein [Priestia sp. OVL9]